MTGIIFKVEGIEDALSMELYIERDKSIKIYKEDFIKVYREGKVEHYVTLDADELGRGHVQCRVELVDKELAYPGEKRPVIVSGYTGYTIPCMGEGKSISCSGYTISFERVKDIPKNDDTSIYVGVISAWVVDYKYITEEMIKQLERKPVERAEYVIPIAEGDRLVVAIPYDQDIKAYVDDGFGRPMPFKNPVMNANGEIQVRVDGIKYKIYGEFNIVDANSKIYIR